MGKKIEPATEFDAPALDAAMRYLRDARYWLRAARAPKSLAKLESTIKSVDGARRHMAHRIARTEKGG